LKGGPSPNPGGRPKVVAEVRALAQQHGPDAIAALAEIALNPKAPTASRVAAAEALLDRGYGRPVQAVQAEVVTATVDAEQLRASLAARIAALALPTPVTQPPLPAATPRNDEHDPYPSEEVPT
jgi:hypothetical protein